MFRLICAIAVILGTFAATPPAAASLACDVQGGTIEWGFKESFRSYISGSIANGEWTVADGATYKTPTFGFSEATGSYHQGTGLIQFAGSITFTGHDAILNTTVANPTVRFEGGTALLLLDVSGTTQQGEPIAQRAVEFMNLDLDAAIMTTSGESVTFAEIPAELTADGAAAFGTYEAGEPFDPVTLTIEVSEACQNAVVVEEEAPPAAPVNWMPLVAVAPLAAVAAVIALRRKRASR